MDIAEDIRPATDRALPVCQLSHRLFHATPGIAFRRTADHGEKVMVVPLGDREAALPMRAIRREFDIDEASEDGQMLALIDAALDHVPGIALGDTLPTEVVNGEASWKVEPHHLWLSAARLRSGLLSWLRPGANPGLEPANAMEALMADPNLRAQVQSAFEQAAYVLGLPDAAAAVAEVDRFAQELSHIEALREWLLGRVQALVRRLASLPPQRGVDRARAEMLQRVGQLSSTALRSLRDRFDIIDAQTGELMAVLRNPEQQIVFIHQHRDQLHAEWLEWEPVLKQWDGLPIGASEAFWTALAATYHLLARRHLPQSAWHRAGQAAMEAVGVREMAW